MNIVGINVSCNDVMSLSSYFEYINCKSSVNIITIIDYGIWNLGSMFNGFSTMNVFFKLTIQFVNKAIS